MVSVGENSSVKSTQIFVDRTILLERYSTENNEVRKDPVNDFDAGWQLVETVGVRPEYYGLPATIYDTRLRLNALTAALS